MEISRRGLIRLAGATGVAVATGTTLALATASPAQASQNGWRWCRQCQGMWFAGNPSRGWCPVPFTEGHSLAGSGNYDLHTFWDFPSGDQDGWSWCRQCAGLWFTFSSPENRGVCPRTGRGHEFTGSEIYSLDKDGGGGQANWRWCVQCQGLWFAGNGTNGRCPASAGGHSLAGSGNYHIDVD